MNHLIVYAHPSKTSLNYAFVQTAVAALEQKGHDVVVRDLYQMGFEPAVTSSEILGGLGEEIIREQEYLLWADVVTFVYPIWWAGMPAMMKGYIDRVFSYGFAYKYVNGVQEGLLKGKKAVILNTQGKSHAEYAQSGLDQALRLTSDKAVFEYSGFEVLYHLFFESVLTSTEETRKGWIAQIADMGSKA